MVDQIFIGQGWFSGKWSNKYYYTNRYCSNSSIYLVLGWACSIFQPAIRAGRARKGSKGCWKCTCIIYCHKYYFYTFGIYFSKTSLFIVCSNLWAGPVADVMAFVLSGVLCIRELRKMREMDSYEKFCRLDNNR